MSRTIYSGKSVKEEYSGEQLSQWLYDGLVGAIMGTGLTSINPETYAFNPGKPQVSAEQENTGLLLPEEGQNQAPQPGTEQKNSTPEEAESTAVNTDPAQHTAVEQAVVDEYQAAVDDNLVNYIETVRDNKGAKIERYTLKPVADRAAKDIMRLTGVDVSGNQTAIEARIVEHILKRHGENGTANHSMRDINDIARIQYVLDNYDTASYGGKTQAYRTMKENGRSAQANTVIFSKAVNGTYYVVEAVPDTKAKTVFVASAYMSSKKTGDAQVADADAWRVTSETKVVQSPAVEANTPTNAILAQSGENYHNNFQASLETGNTGERSGKGAPSGGAVERSETEGGTTAAANKAANTDPAALARQQQYQTEIAAALRAGDYERAHSLYKEFGNPDLRALNEIQTQMSFESFFQSEGVNKIKSFDESEDIINRTGKAEANGRFLNKSEKLYRYAPMIKPIDSFEDFTCHADPYSFYIDMVGEGKEKDFIELSPADYAEAIRNSKSYRGGNIRLISCQAGAIENGAAQQIADALQVIVMAPTEIVHVDENGEMFLTDNEILAEIWYDADREERAKFKETGKWLTFYPRKE
ncbi:MAG: hypothetical protein ACI3VA_10160 [Candidatus Limivicinus sp.]